MEQQPNPAEYQSGENKTRRRPASLALKITAGQTMRVLWTFIKLDALIFLLAFGLILFERGNTAVSLTERYGESGLETAVRLPGVVSAEMSASPFDGLRLDPKIESLFGLPLESTYALALTDTPEQSFFEFYTGRPLFSMSLRTGEERYANFVFDIDGSLRPLCYAALAVVIIEGLMLIGMAGATRRSVRRTLAPISQLAATTQSISAEPPAQYRHVRPWQRPAPVNTAGGPDGLGLSGTIDTLNNITAGRLDTRIDTEHERAELKGLAEAVNSMLDRLDDAYSSQLRFVSDASHELRTPIAVLQGYANLLDRWGKEDPEVLQESIDAIKSEAESMKKLVEQLLFLARSDNNAVEMQVQPLDVSGVAEEVLRDTQLIDRSHLFVSNVDPGLWVTGDAGLLKQALRVFVDNAVKYTPEGERIIISAKRAGGGVCVSVTDNGIGIPDEELPRVFERFYRSDESRARATGGTGLGLSIAKWIVQRHGGELEVTSRKDMGTRFTVSLPETVPHEQPDEAAG